MGAIAERSVEDLALSQRLKFLRSEHEDQWTYRGQASVTKRLTLFQYPAMMVADMQQDLLRTLLDMGDAEGPVFDPFMGSGTILTVAMNLGQDVVGWDVNPLAILICRVKAGPFHLDAFEEAVCRATSGPYMMAKPEERFENWRHWFTPTVASGLSGLRERIRREKYAPTRRFLWTCLAETVRLTSNSRTSTVKLHRRVSEEIANRPDPHQVFKRVALENLKRLASAAEELEQCGYLRKGHYKGDIQLRLGDVRRLAWEGHSSSALITSPPYGDNLSTVSYGQQGLPRVWLTPDV